MNLGIKDLIFHQFMGFDETPKINKKQEGKNSAFPH